MSNEFSARSLCVQCIHEITAVLQKGVATTIFIYELTTNTVCVHLGYEIHTIQSCRSACIEHVMEGVVGNRNRLQRADV